MSEENVEIARRAYTALAEEGVEALLVFADPEFEVTTPPSLASEPDTYRGHDGVQRWFGAFSDGLEGVSVLHARGRTTGIDVEQHAFLLWTLREGMAVKVLIFVEREPALEAAGFSE
jgi:ketosteroid isomerase-like protein